MADRTQISFARRVQGASCALLLAAQPLVPAFAGPNEQAVRLYNRLAGVPPSATVLAQMATDIAGGNAIAAAQLAMQNPNFYNVTLRNFAAPMTNKAQSTFVPLNDYTATIIGMIRDNVPFNTVLTADLVYVGNASGAPAYSPANNNHYQYLDTKHAVRVARHSLRSYGGRHDHLRRRVGVFL
jgi:hypothetical protein